MIITWLKMKYYITIINTLLSKDKTAVLNYYWVNVLLVSVRVIQDYNIFK